jgi:putative transposase
MVRPGGRPLVSQRRDNSALYCPSPGPYAGRGPRRTYGPKLAYGNLPAASLQAVSIDEELETKIYQMSLWHKKFAEMLNIVVIVKTHLQTHKTAHVVLCSSDVTLVYTQLIDYYRLRCQRECNFRDAKQYWGLENCMSVNEKPVYNSANMAIFMVNVSQALMRPMRAQWPAFSVNDLKAWFRGRKYVSETLKLLPEMPDAIFIDQWCPIWLHLGGLTTLSIPLK